ncbi:MAG: peptidase MA family metallohydrolase [Anaerolineales bacterium]|jgi:hypothetical protein|nr:peptidase MA family metallohydrolase [Anaerolineales bacterium]
MRKNIFSRISMLFFIGIASALLYPAIANAVTNVQVLDTEVEFTFGGSIKFHATLQSASPVEEVAVFIQAEGQIDAETIPADFNSSGTIDAEFDLSQHPLRGFSEITYWYRVTLKNGEVFTSEEYQFIYEDSRFDWQTLQSGDFEVHWFEGEVDFAQEMVNIAAASLERAQSYLPITLTETIHIYAYDSAKELRSALQLSGQDWVAGHADPDLGVVLVSLPPGPEQQLEMERQIPHELMHVLMYQTIGVAYERLPIWLNEGLASITELYPNPDYYTILNNAYEEDDLLPINSLCQVFPQDSFKTLLAYAESASFTHYLNNQYGMPGLESLVIHYADGLDCQHGAEQALGSTLTQLETQWRRETFNEDPLITVIENLLPWVLLLLIMVGLPLLFSLVRARKNRTGK